MQRLWEKSARERCLFQIEQIQNQAESRLSAFQFVDSIVFIKTLSIFKVASVVRVLVLYHSIKSFDCLFQLKAFMTPDGLSCEYGFALRRTYGHFKWVTFKVIQGTKGDLYRAPPGGGAKCACDFARLSLKDFRSLSSVKAASTWFKCYRVRQHKWTNVWPLAVSWPESPENCKP